MLSYLIDRPQVLHRHVDGHAGKEFFQRVSRKCPPCVQIARITLDGGKWLRLNPQVIRPALPRSILQKIVAVYRASYP
jgi:DNA primase